MVPFLRALYRHLGVPQAADVLHIDAHPDLSLPSGRAGRARLSEYCDEDALCELLGEDGGIAEFLVPLRAQNIVHGVWWMRAKESDQLPDGALSVRVWERESDDDTHSHTHAHTKSCAHSRVCVDCALPYYLDEGVYAPLRSDQCAAFALEIFTFAESTDLLAHFHLSSSTNDNNNNNNNNNHSVETNRIIDSCNTSSAAPSNSKHSDAEMSSSSRPWVLDICLDYFVVQNPFLLEIIPALSESPSESLSLATEDFSSLSTHTHVRMHACTLTHSHMNP